MKIKVVVIDLELSSAFKRRACLAAAALMLVGSTLAYAAPAHVWSAGDTLTAEHLNAAFGDLDTRLAKVEGKVQAIEAEASRSRSAFMAKQTVAQDIPQGADHTLLMNHEYYDDSNEYDPQTGIFKPSKDGFYEIGCSWEADVPTAGSSFYAEAGIGIDGDKVYGGLHSDAVYSSRSVRIIHKLKAGAEVTCIAFQVSTFTVRTSAELDTKFEAIRL